MTKQPIKLEDFSLDPEKYYMLFPAHAGDTFTHVGFLRWFENAVGGKVVCLVRPEQEFVMRIFDREEYELVDECVSPTRVISEDRKLRIAQMCPTPSKGALFLAFHSARCHREVGRMRGIYTHRMEYIAFLYRAPLPPRISDFQKPSPERLCVSSAFKENVAAIAPLDKIVLLSPQSLSWEYPGLDEYLQPFWEREIRKWTGRGYKVIVSGIKEQRFANAEFLPMNMEESLWLGTHCHHVIALRSGYMDILAFFRETFTVVYPSYEQYTTGNFLDGFHKRFHEVILPDMAEKAKVDKAALENKTKEAGRRNTEKKKEEEFFHKIDARLEKLKVEMLALLSEQARILKKTNEEINNKINARDEKLRREMFALSADHAKMIRDWQHDTQHTNMKICDGIRKVILSPLTWLNLQRCRLGSHLLFGRLRQHYGIKKRRLRTRILEVRGFLNGTFFIHK